MSCPRPSLLLPLLALAGWPNAPAVCATGLQVRQNHPYPREAAELRRENRALRRVLQARRLGQVPAHVLEPRAGLDSPAGAAPWHPPQAFISQFSFGNELRSYDIRFAGVQTEITVKFIARRAQWLAMRTFAAEIFFCDGQHGGNNGHEGAITNVYGAILSNGNPAAEVVLDIGGNLGMYSIIPAKFGYQVFTFDMQPICLHATHLLTEANGIPPERVTLINAALTDKDVGTVYNSDDSCDYVNYFVSDTAASDEKGHTSGVKTPVPAMPFDVASPVGQQQPVRLVKIDTEGAEVKVLRGMSALLASGRVETMVIEVTPGHWHRVGMEPTDPIGIQTMVDLTEKYGFDAYLMWTQPARMPPSFMHGSVVEKTERHPINIHYGAGSVGVEDTGCTGTPFHKILDMRAFMTQYCIEYLKEVKCGNPGGTCSGYCGNLLLVRRGAPTTTE